MLLQVLHIALQMRDLPAVAGLGVPRLLLVVLKIFYRLEQVVFGFASACHIDAEILLKVLVFGLSVGQFLLDFLVIDHHAVCLLF